ncbi:MAG: hypothetical protein ABGX36_02340 [Cycloclasticus sp.]
MKEKLKTWGELCDKAGIDIGKTPAETEISRIITKCNVNTTEEPITLSSILPK